MNWVIVHYWEPRWSPSQPTKSLAGHIALETAISYASWSPDDESRRAAVTRPVGANPRGLIAAQINADQAVDLAVANRDSNSVSVLLNDGAWPDVSPPRVRIGDTTVTEGHTGTAAVQGVPDFRRREGMGGDADRTAQMIPKEGIELRGRRRQPGEVERDAANESRLVGLGRRSESFRLESRHNEPIDGGRSRVLHFGEQTALRFVERPVRLDLTPFVDPAADQFNLRRSERLAAVGAGDAGRIGAAPPAQALPAVERGHPLRRTAPGRIGRR